MWKIQSSQNRVKWLLLVAWTLVMFASFKEILSMLLDTLPGLGPMKRYAIIYQVIKSTTIYHYLLYLSFWKLSWMYSIFLETTIDAFILNHIFTFVKVVELPSPIICIYSEHIFHVPKVSLIWSYPVEDASTSLWSMRSATMEHWQLWAICTKKLFSHIEVLCKWLKNLLIVIVYRLMTIMFLPMPTKYSHPKNKI